MIFELGILLGFVIKSTEAFFILQPSSDKCRPESLFFYWKLPKDFRGDYVRTTDCELNAQLPFMFFSMITTAFILVIFMETIKNGIEGINRKVKCCQE